MPSWINRSYLSRLFKWNSQSYKNESNKPGDLDLQSRMIEYGVKLNPRGSSLHLGPSINMMVFTVVSFTRILMRSGNETMTLLFCIPVLNRRLKS